MRKWRTHGEYQRQARFAARFFDREVAGLFTFHKDNNRSKRTGVFARRSPIDPRGVG